MPKVEILQQNTPQWQAWRARGLGSSDAPVVMGDSRWLTSRKLWEIKTGRRAEDGVDSENRAMKRGRALEGAAREAYEAYTRVQMEPHCLIHGEYSWMRASLDGITFDGSTILEIKCPMRERDRILAQQGRIPPHYHAQLQHQLEVSGAAQAHYWSFDGAAGILIEVSPDHAYAKRLVEAEAAFWQLVVKNHWPEPDQEALDLSSDPKWREAALRYREAKLKLESATLVEQHLRGILDRMATSRRTYGCGVELVKSSRRGAVDYSAVPELRGVDLEPYRKPQVPFVKINLIEPSSQ
jgi:putative phage-type endonuclease